MTFGALNAIRTHRMRIILRDPNDQSANEPNNSNRTNNMWRCAAEPPMLNFTIS